jgi:serine/threonine protein kinase
VEPSSPCPGEEILRSLGTDALDEASFAAVEEHVEGCPDCHTILERLARRRPGLRLVLPGPERLPRIPGFAIQHELGGGAMGVVYLAVRTGGLGRAVAIKVLRSAAGGESPAARRHWLREARAVSNIRHPNVVTLYDHGEADGWLYLVLEYVPGGTLKERMGNPLPPRVAAGLVETIARTVGCFHVRGLHHLDLKPSNILLDGAEKDAPWDRVIPKVSDFGLALSDGDDDPGLSEPSQAAIRGTPSYMAPEQAAASRSQLGAATDIHALGAILYELLTGRPPFQGASTLETLDQVRHQNPVPPRRLNPQIPRDLETIALKCLEKSPSRRYASAEALAGDLRRWLDGRPTVARPLSSPERTWRWCRRRPVVAALATSLALTLGISFPTVFWLWRHAAAERNRADAARRQAEADFEVASETLGQLVEMSTGGASHLPKAIPPEQTIALLSQTRERLLDLAGRRPDQKTFARRLSSVEDRLFQCLMQRKRYEEARILAADSLGITEQILRHDPHDGWRLYWRARCLNMLAQVAHSQGRIDETVDYLGRAVRSGEVALDIMPGAERINFLAENRRTLARLLITRGHTQEAEALLVANRQMLDQLGPESEEPRLAAMRLITRLDLSHLGSESPRAPVPARRSDQPSPRDRDALSTLTSAEGDRLPVQAWAELAARALGPTKGRGSAAAREVLAGFELSTLLSETASELRRRGRLGDAQRITDRLIAFNRLLVTRYADQPAAHLALCEAYLQRSKDAWGIDDRGAVERNLKLSLESALQATAIDPSNELARFQVDQLQHRLSKLRPLR